MKAFCMASLIGLGAVSAQVRDVGMCISVNQSGFYERMWGPGAPSGSREESGDRRW